MIKLELPEKNSFNALRFFCCIIIIIGHCLDLSGLSQVMGIRKYIDMHVCVCVFFILSGFFVTRSYLQKKENGCSIISFYKLRAFRILPMYYFVVITSAILFYFFSETTPRLYFMSFQFWKYIFWNVLLLNFMCVSPIPIGTGYPFIVPAINGALWTIKIEVAFYILLPLLIFLIEKIKSLRGKNYFLLVIYILSVFWNHFFLFVGIKLESNFVSDLAHQFPGFLSFFVVGIFCILNWTFITEKIKIMIIPAIFIFFLHYVTNTEILMPFMLMIICIWFGMNCKCLYFIGYKKDYSFGMYLVHFPLIQACVALGFFRDKYIITIFSVIVLSYILSFFLEIGSNKIKKIEGVKK